MKKIFFKYIPKTKEEKFGPIYFPVYLAICEDNSIPLLHEEYFLVGAWTIYFNNCDAGFRALHSDN
jgi:hypothetical protein